MRRSRSPSREWLRPRRARAVCGLLRAEHRLLGGRHVRIDIGGDIGRGVGGERRTGEAHGRLRCRLGDRRRVVTVERHREDELGLGERRLLLAQFAFEFDRVECRQLLAERHHVADRHVNRRHGARGREPDNCLVDRLDGRHAGQRRLHRLRRRLRRAERLLIVVARPYEQRAGADDRGDGDHADATLDRTGAAASLRGCEGVCGVR